MTPTPDPTYAVETSVTAYHTTAPVPVPPDDTKLTDQLQGWGTLLATCVAVAGLIVTIRTAKRDRMAGERQRQEDRADAERRLADERRAATENLQRQIDEQRDRDRRDFLIEQLQRAGDAYAEWTAPNPEKAIARYRIAAILPALLPHHASLLKAFFMSVYEDSQPAMTMAQRRLDKLGLTMEDVTADHIFRELADNIEELLNVRGAPDE